MLLLATSCRSGPRDYNECVLESMKGVTSDDAARLIMASCLAKFPPKPKTEEPAEPLGLFELVGLTGRAGISYGDTYRGNLYNGNPNVTVSEVEITVTAKHTSGETTRKYRVPVTIPPLSAKDFSFDIVVGEEGSDYSWSISGAKGYRGWK